MARKFVNGRKYEKPKIPSCIFLAAGIMEEQQIITPAIRMLGDTIVRET